MTINLKIDISSLKAEIIAEIQKQDALAEKAANQLLVEGINVAQKLVLKDTNDLKDSIPAASGVKRLGPCRYQITLANGMDYGEPQEFGPKQSKKVWRFRPHIRPAVAIMEQKFDEVVDRVWSQ
jgi:hypothetical protein